MKKIEKIWKEELKYIHLRYILKDKPINLIYVYDDIKNAHFLTEDIIEEDIDKEEERFNNEIEMLNMTNQELLDLSSQEIRSITNLELIDRIAKLDKKKLSESQLKKLKEIYSQKIIINREDVEKLIEELKECKRLFITPRVENDTFLDKYDLYVDECLEIIHSLNISDYYATAKNYNINFLGNDLIVFEKDNVALSNGKNLGDIIIYIKLDLTSTQIKGTIVAISFHQKKASNLPYKDDTNISLQILKGNISFDNFIKDAGVILVDNAFAFDINEWEEEIQKEIDKELGESSDVSLKKPQFIKYKLTSDKIKQVVDKIIVSDFNIVNYWETNQFKKKNNLIDEDLKNILRTLTIKDCKTNSKGVNGKYNEAIIFIKNTNIKNVTNIDFYIKLDYDTIEDSPVIVISFHSKSNLNTKKESFDKPLNGETKFENLEEIDMKRYL